MIFHSGRANARSLRLPVVRVEKLNLERLRIGGLECERLCQFPVEVQNAVIEAVAANLDIA